MGLFRIQGCRTKQCTHCAVAWAPDNALACVARTKLHVSRGEQQMILGDNFLQRWLVSFATSNKCLYCLTFQCNVFEPLPLVSRAFNWLLVTLHQPSSGNRCQEAISNLLKSCKSAPWTIGHPWIATLVPSWFGHPPRKTNKVPVAWIGKWWKGKKFGMVWQCLQRRWLYMCLCTVDYSCLCVFLSLCIPTIINKWEKWILWHVMTMFTPISKIKIASNTWCGPAWLN